MLDSRGEPADVDRQRRRPSGNSVYWHSAPSGKFSPIASRSCARARKADPASLGEGEPLGGVGIVDPSN